MNVLNIVDLNTSTELDQQAMSTIVGGGMWHRQSRGRTSNSRWSLKRLSSAYQGQLFHDGYLSKHYVERWEYKRTQTRVDTWNKYRRV